MQHHPPHSRPGIFRRKVLGNVTDHPIGIPRPHPDPEYGQSFPYISHFERQSHNRGIFCVIHDFNYIWVLHLLNIMQIYNIAILFANKNNLIIYNKYIFICITL
nr:MAG TPA: hypothetical protein [Caudoviricetes sp.]